MGRRRYKGPVFGPFFFNMYKPVGMTSFDVIRHLQRNLPHKIGKIGHFGTLDPFADGVLLVGIGSAPRLNNWTQTLPKEYIATGILGVKSSTGDNTAPEDEYLKDESFKEGSLSAELIQSELNSFLGTYMQRPHKYSAAKHEGKSLHQWAREGVEIVKEPVSRFVYEIELISVEGRHCKFRVKVGSGTYIRVLFEDLAKKLGTLGHLTELTRTEIGQHHIGQSARKEQWPVDCDSSDIFLANHAKAIDQIVSFPELELQDTMASRFSNGVKLTLDIEDGEYWVVNKGLVLGLAKSFEGLLTPSVNFVPAASQEIDLTPRNSLDE